MSHTPSLDDTQPRSPFAGEPLPPPNVRPPGEEESASGGSGCLPVGVLGAILVVGAVLIVALAAAAGWTSGQRQANINATATQSAAIEEQLARIPAEISSGNLILLDTRIRFLVTLTPGVPGVADFAATATALFLTSQPTATPTPSPTPDPSLAEVQSETEPVAITPAGSGGYDLASILAQADQAVTAGRWTDAVDLLDVIIAVDNTFETARVRSLLTQALNSEARRLYENNQPAAGNVVVGRIESLGLALADGLSYERYAAQIYLNARAAVGTGSPVATSALRELLNLGPGRYYAEAQQLLFNQYVIAGDAWVAQGEYCPAIAQYQNALNVLSSGSVSGKLSNANAMCANATPTPDPLMPVDPNAPTSEFAPIGVPGT